MYDQMSAYNWRYLLDDFKYRQIYILRNLCETTLKKIGLHHESSSHHHVVIFS